MTYSIQKEELVMTTAVFILYSLSVLTLLCGAYFYLGYRSRKREWKGRINKWFPEDKRKSFISVIGDRFDRSKLAESLTEKLQNANIPILPSEYLGIYVLGLLALFVLFNNMFKLSTILSIVIPVLILVATHPLVFLLEKTNTRSDLMNS